MSLNIVVSADVAAAGKQIDDFSKKSRTALTSLSLVAQDLPFGFIGIQNNLPGVISSFGELTKEAGGTGNALKQLGSSLIGPAGLFLAFSAVTSVVTMLIMKYGSFGEAMNAIFAKTSALSIKVKELSDSYKEFNKDLKTSQDIIGQEGASVTGQIAKVDSLTKVVLDQTKSYNERNAALNTLKEIDKDYFENLDIEKSKISTLTNAVEGYKNSLIAAAVTKGFEQEIGRTSVELSKQVSILKDLDEARKTAAAAPIRIVGKAELIDRTEIQKTESAYNKQLKVIKELTKRKEELNAEIKKSVDAQIALRAPVDATNAALEKQRKIDKELAKLKLKKPKKEKPEFRRTSWVKNLLKKEMKDVELEIIPDIKFKPPSLDESVLIKNLRIQQKILAEEYMKMKDIMSNIFFTPIENLFTNFFETGKFAFKQFGDAVLKQIQQLVSKIIATGIIKLLASILVPGGSVAAKAFGMTSGGGIGGILADIFGGGVANPSFGGVGPGALGMSGQVNVVLRGSDLVGALNRTNATINRVG